MGSIQLLILEQEFPFGISLLNCQYYHFQMSNLKNLLLNNFEHKVQNYLKVNFSNWTSGNDNIDNLIKKCQMETLVPELVIEWIPYNNLQNIKYLTEGGWML